jgi:hypothetical protein
MTAPHYLQSAFRYIRLVGVIDVQTIIDSVKDEVLNQLPVGSRWTDLGGDEVRSPLDADGRFVRFNMNRIAALNLEAIITDPDARSFTRRTQMAAAVAVNIFSGPSHLFIDFENGEGIWAAVVDLFPLPQRAHEKFVVGQGFRNAADVDDATYRVGSLFERNATDVYASNVGAMDTLGGSFGGGVDVWLMRSLAGARIGTPSHVFNDTPAPVRTRIMGRLPQTVLVNHQEIQGTEIVYPMDETTTGTFRVLGILVQSVELTGKMAVRRA